MKKIKPSSNIVFWVFLFLILLTFLTIGIFFIFNFLQIKGIAQIVQKSILATSSLKNERIVKVAEEQNNASISLEADKTKIEIGDKIEVSIKTNQIAVAACTIHLYFDSNKLKVINIPENANVVDNKLVYTWFDERTEKIEQTIQN